MEKGYRALYQGGQGEITEKKSRFIATTFPIETEEEALHHIEGMKKKYWDARHNCYAYVLGDNHQIQRCSDDGEPSGTAGRPMLDVLLGEDVHNILAVVTRYFGGTLLGTGGLVRAYTQAVHAGLEASRIVEKECGIPLVLVTDYNGIGKIQYQLGQKQIPVLDSVFEEKVTVKAVASFEKKEGVIKDLTQATNGKIQIQEEEPVYFSVIDGKVRLWEL